MANFGLMAGIAAAVALISSMAGGQQTGEAGLVSQAADAFINMQKKGAQVPFQAAAPQLKSRSIQELTRLKPEVKPQMTAQQQRMYSAPQIQNAHGNLLQRMENGTLRNSQVAAILTEFVTPTLRSGRQVPIEKA